MSSVIGGGGGLDPLSMMAQASPKVNNDPLSMMAAQAKTNTIIDPLTAMTDTGNIGKTKVVAAGGKQQSKTKMGAT